MGHILGFVGMPPVVLINDPLQGVRPVGVATHRYRRGLEETFLPSADSPMTTFRNASSPRAARECSAGGKSRSTNCDSGDGNWLPKRRHASWKRRRNSLGRVRHPQAVACRPVRAEQVRDEFIELSKSVVDSHRSVVFHNEARVCCDGPGYCHAGMRWTSALSQ